MATIKSFLRIATVMALLGTSAMQQPAHAQLETAATVGAATAMLKGQLNDLINQAKAAGDFLIFRLGSQLLLLIDSWEKANSNLIKLAFKELEKTQANFFNEVEQTVTTASREVGKNLETSRQIVEQANQVVLDAKFWDGKPVFYRYMPTAITSDIRPTGETVVLRLRGSNLRDSIPSIKDANGKVAGQKVLRVTQQEIEIELPRQVFSFDVERPRVSNLFLNLTYPDPSWFSRMFGGQETREYPLNIYLLPQKLASFKLESVVTETPIDNVRHEREYWVDGKGGTHDRCQGPQDSWRIDPGTVQVIRQWGKGGTVHLRGERVGSTGFCVELGLAGGCGRFGTDPCHQHVVIGWHEERQRTEEVPGQPYEGQLSWAKDEPIPINPRTKRFTLTIRDFAGRTSVADGSRSLDYLSVDYRPDTIQLTLRPNIPRDLYQ